MNRLLHPRIGLLLSIFILFQVNINGQKTVQPDRPAPVKKQQVIFYLHGQLVTDYGNNAVSPAVPEWGAYEYLNILDSIRRRGVSVISEQRVRAIPDSVYAYKMIQQIDSLLAVGIHEENIAVVGASAGWNIALIVSSKLKRNNIHYVLMGGCWPETYKTYLHLPLYGNFLSIIEKTDPHKSCLNIFQNRTTSLTYQEIEIHTGLSHGFIYKGLTDWIDPIVSWMNNLH